MLRLLQKTSLDVRQRDYAVKSEGAARGLLGLLNDILDFSKIEAGHLGLDPHPMRLEELLRDLSVILAAQLDKRDIEVLFDLDPDLPAILIADDLRLQQVLINLAGNAIKFTAAGAGHLAPIDRADHRRGEHGRVLRRGVRHRGAVIADASAQRQAVADRPGVLQEQAGIGHGPPGDAIVQRLAGQRGLHLEAAVVRAFVTKFNKIPGHAIHPRGL